MPYLYGEKLNKTEVRKRVGDISQIVGAVVFEYSEGKAKGGSMLKFRTG